MISVDVDLAQSTLAALLDRVEAGEEFALTRHGRIVAALVPPVQPVASRTSAAYEAADAMAARLEQARDEPLASPSLEAGRAEELGNAIRADRSHR